MIQHHFGSEYAFHICIYVQGLLHGLAGKLNSTSLPSWKGFIDTPSTSLLKRRSTSTQNSTNHCLDFWANPASSEGCEWNPENGWISNSNFDVPVRSFQRFPNVVFLKHEGFQAPWISFQFGPRVMFKTNKYMYNHIYIYTDITYVYSHCLWPPLSNSDHQEYYMFSRESLQAFMHHCYWEGPHPIYTRGVLPFFFWKNCICFNPTWIAIDRIASLKKKTPFLLATFPTVSKNKNLWQTQE